MEQTQLTPRASYTPRSARSPSILADVQSIEMHQEYQGRQRPEAWRENPTPIGKARQRASYRLRDLKEHLENAETTLELLSEQNYLLRVKVLQCMREKIFYGLVRRIYNEWAKYRWVSEKEKELLGVYVRLQERIIQKLAAVFPSPQWWARSCFQGWKLAIASLHQENKLMDELAGFRKGRADLIQQYRDIEVQYVQARDRAQELELRIKECGHGNKVMQEDVTEANAQVGKFMQTIDELKAQSRVLTDQLGATKDTSSERNREVKALTEKTSRLHQRIQQDEAERKALSNQLLGMENAVDDCRSQMATYDGVDKNYEAMLREKDLKIENLMAQIQDSQHCIQSLSVGATDYFSKVITSRSDTLQDLEGVTLTPRRTSVEATPRSPRKNVPGPDGIWQTPRTPGRSPEASGIRQSPASSAKPGTGAAPSRYSPG